MFVVLTNLNSPRQSGTKYDIVTVEGEKNLTFAKNDLSDILNCVHVQVKVGDVRELYLVSTHTALVVYQVVWPKYGRQNFTTVPFLKPKIC